MPLQQWAKRLEQEIIALYFAYKDPRTPWYARLWAALVVAYAVSPIDLIPDPIPIVGYLDDLILVPLGIAIAIRLVPAGVWTEASTQAKEAVEQFRPGHWLITGAVIGLWLLAGALLLGWVWQSWL